MSTSAEKPNAIIFGGLNTCSRALAALLVPLEGERLVGHLRIVDKYSVAPPTTYLGAEFPKILKQPNVEYKQANLTVAATISAMFDPPGGVAPYSYVFDYTGEINHDRPEPVYINNTFNVARLLGLEAAKRRVKSYVRLLLAIYDTPDKGAHDEKADVKPAKTLGTWWHEMARALASIEDLNLVIVRIGFMYGPYTNFGLLASVLTVGSVYGHMKKPMKTLWGPGKDPVNCSHVDDISGALWACSQWMASLGRKEANIIAGEELIFHNDKRKVASVEGMPPHDAKIIAPVFNIVDDSNLTLAKAGQTIAAFFGTTHEFYNSMLIHFTKLKDVVEEINEHHVGEWTKMLTEANPPITNTPLSAYMDEYLLDKHKLGFNNAKIKEVVQYKLKRPEFGPETIKEIVDKWKAEGIWPLLDGQ